MSSRFVIRSIASNYAALSILKRQLKVDSDDPVAQEAPLTLNFSFEEAAAATTMTPLLVDRHDCAIHRPRKEV